MIIYQKTKSRFVFKKILFNRIFDKIITNFVLI